jgi:hypothetical protein
MVQKIFKCSPSNRLEKIMELRGKGWNIVQTMDTSTEQILPDAHGIGYGGPEISILCEREKGYEKPKILQGSVHTDKNGLKVYELPISRVCNPPGPGR